MSNNSNELPNTEYELLKLLIEELNKKDNTNKYDTLTIVLIVLFGLILCQKVFKYGHRAYKHYSATNTRHNSEDTSI